MNKKARSLKSMPGRGDVFSVPLGNWGFTACRVVAVKARPVSVLVVGSEYLDAKPASLNDPNVYKISVLTHHAFDNEPLAFWTPMVIAPEFEKLGSAEPAEGEDQLAKGKMANWDYIVVHRIMQAEWDSIPRPTGGEWRRCAARTQTSDITAKASHADRDHPAVPLIGPSGCHGRG